jgi:hypothetical protein
MFSSKTLMNSFGSSFKYFSNFSHKFGDAATDKNKEFSDTVCGARGSVVVKALCYKPEGHRFDSQ